VLGCHRRHSRCNQAIVPSGTGRPVLQPPAGVASRAIRATAIYMMDDRVFHQVMFPMGESPASGSRSLTE
jgi:hypothetical protein